MRLQGKVCFITGGARGYGEAMARGAAREGAQVALVDRDETALFEAAKSLASSGADVLPIVADITDAALVEAAVKQCIKRFKRIDAVANNAGIIRGGKLESMSLETWDEVMNVNLRGALLVIQAAGREMIASGNGGSIVNLGSIAHRVPKPGVAAYTVSKAALHALTLQVAVEWGPYGIRCNSLNSGPSTWGMTDWRRRDAASADRADVIPLKKLTTLDDIANAFVFLASPESASISGVDLLLDGAFSHAVQAVKQQLDAARSVPSPVPS